MVKTTYNLYKLTKRKCLLCFFFSCRLEALRRKFSKYAYNDINFIGVNSKKWHSQLSLAMLTRRVTFSLYQSTHNNDVFQILNGQKDDVFIYDR